MGLTVALKPLYDAFGLKRVVVTTMQALSGAGYPGVSSLDTLDNVVPYIGQEEEKLVIEPLKMLGTVDAATGTVITPSIAVSPTCNRVTVRDGHLETVSVELERDASISAVIDALRSFKSRPYALGCPSATDPTIIYRTENDRPQPYYDRDSGGGMAVTVGRLRPCEVLDYKMVVLSHNTIRCRRRLHPKRRVDDRRGPSVMAWPRAKLSDVMGQRVIYRNLAPVMPGLAGLEDLWREVRLDRFLIPRKTSMEYARIVWLILQDAQRLRGSPSTRARAADR